MVNLGRINSLLTLNVVIHYVNYIYVVYFYYIYIMRNQLIYIICTLLAYKSKFKYIIDEINGQVDQNKWKYCKARENNNT